MGRQRDGARREAVFKGTFDLSLAVTLLCFLERQERERMVGELVRVTRQGGRVVLGELARYSIWAHSAA